MQLMFWILHFEFDQYDYITFHSTLWLQLNYFQQAVGSMKADSI